MGNMGNLVSQTTFEDLWSLPIYVEKLCLLKLWKCLLSQHFSLHFISVFMTFHDFLRGLRAASSASLRAWANFTHIIKTELHYVLCEKMSSGEKISGDGKRTNSFRVCPRPPQPLELETKVFKEKAPTLLGPSLGSHERHYANQTTCWLWIHNLCVSILILFLLTYCVIVNSAHSCVFIVKSVVGTFNHRRRY